MVEIESSKDDKASILTAKMHIAAKNELIVKLQLNKQTQINSTN